MWLLRAAFDDEDNESTKEKLLLPGVEYLYGRKRGPGDLENKLFTKSKVISRTEGFFIVSALPDNFASDSALTYRKSEAKNKVVPLRDGIPIEEDPDHPKEYLLADGDNIDKGMVISIINVAVYVFLASSVSRDSAQELSQRAARLGVRVARTWSELTTHYVIDRFPDISDALSLQPKDRRKRREKNGDSIFKEKPSLQWLCGLLRESHIHFVKLSWLEAFIQKGELPRGNGNYEETYNPPSEQDHLPDGPNPELWEPREVRHKMFREMSFLVIYHGTSMDKTFEALVKTGGGSIQSYSISAQKAIPSSEKWAQVIRKAKLKKSGSGISRIVLVGLQKEVLETHEDWSDVYLEGAEMVDMQFVYDEDVIMAVLKGDISYIDCSIDIGGPEEDLLKAASLDVSPGAKSLNTDQPFSRSTVRPDLLNPSEPSPLNLSGGSSNQRQSAESAIVHESEGETQSRSLPPRRRNRTTAPLGAALFGLDDDSVIVEERSGTPLSAPAPAPSSPIQHVKETVHSILQRPKRKINPKQPDGLIDLFGINDGAEDASSPAEPSYKKFKRDFESNLYDSQSGNPSPDVGFDVDSRSGGSYPGMDPISSVQSSLMPLSDSLAESQPLFHGPPTSVVEQELQSVARGKRKASGAEDGTHMQGNYAFDSRPKKRQATVEPESIKGQKKAIVGSQLATDAREESQVDRRKRGGAVENGVDTDSQFLHAMASLKKGRRAEDNFDREFNNLRISKPQKGDEVDLERERRRREELEAFEEMEKDINVHGNFMVVVESDGLLRNDGGRKQVVPRNEDAVPNFKMFKKKVPLRRAAMMEIAPDKTVDYGQGNGYWEKENSPVATLESHTRFRPQLRRGRGAAARANNQHRPLRVEDSGSEAENRSDVSLPKRATRKGGGKAKSATKEYEPNDSDLNFSDVDRRPSGTLRSSGLVRRKPPVEADDDEIEDFGDAIDAIGPDVSDLDVPSQTMKSTIPNSGQPPGASSAGAPPTPSTRQTRSGSRALNEGPGVASQIATRPSHNTAKRRPRLRHGSDSDGADFLGFSSSKRAKKS